MDSMENLDVQTSTYLIANQSVDLPDPHRGDWFSTKLWTDKVLGIIKSLNKPQQTISNMLAEVQRGYYKYISIYAVQHCFVYKSTWIDKMVNPAILESQAARLFNKLFRPLNNSAFYDSDFNLLQDTNSLEVWHPLGNEDIDDEFNATSILLLNKSDIAWAIHSLRVLQHELNTVRDELLALANTSRSAA